MSVCRRRGRALKGRVSLLQRVTEQSDGSQRAQNNSDSSRTPRRQQWNQPTGGAAAAAAALRVRVFEPLFRSAFISEGQTVSGVRRGTFLCVNCLSVFFFFALFHIHGRAYGPHLYSLTFTLPLFLFSRSHAILSSGTISTRAGYTCAALREAAATATWCRLLPCC